MSWIEKISEEEIKAKGVGALSNRPNQTNAYGTGGMTAQALKDWFDNLAKLLYEKQNALIDETNPEKYAPNLPLGITSDINTVSDFVEALANGDFANEALMVLDSEGKKISLQSWLESHLLAFSESNEGLQEQIDAKVQKSSAKSALYGTGKNGEEMMRTVSKDPVENYIPQYSAGGALKVGAAVNDDEAVQKKDLKAFVEKMDIPDGASECVYATDGSSTKLIEVLSGEEDSVDGYADTVAKRTKDGRLMAARHDSEYLKNNAHDDEVVCVGDIRDFFPYSISLDMSDDYVITLNVYTMNGDNIYSKTIDLPAEFAFVRADVTSDGKGIEFTLQNGEKVTVSLESVLGGLITAETLAQDVIGNSTDKAVSQNAVKFALGGKLDALENGDRNTPWLYGNDWDGTYKLFKTSPHGKGGQIVLYGDPTKTAASEPAGTIGVHMPEKPYQAAPRQYVDDGLEGKLNKNSTTGSNTRVYGITAKGEQVLVNLFTKNKQGYVPLYGTKDGVSGDSDEGGVLVTGMPEKPYHSAPKQYVDREIDKVYAEVDFLKDVAFGTLYNARSVESKINPVTVPSNALPAASIDKIGTGISQGIPNLITSVSCDPNGGTATIIDANTIRFNGTVYNPTIDAQLRENLKPEQTYYFRVSVVSGSYERSDGASYLYVSDSMMRGLTDEVVSSTSWSESNTAMFVLNAGEDAFITYHDLVLRFELGTSVSTEGKPIASVRKGGETIYTVPEAIRAIKARANSGVDLRPAYGLALSDTVYNYLDLEAKQYVIKCAIGIDENNGEAVLPHHETVDVSAYISDEDGEIEVSAGDKILFVGADGASVGAVAPSTVTYLVKMGG